MSAAELIEKIKVLPPDEMEIVRQFVLNGAAAASDRPPVRHMSDEQFEAATKRVFEVHGELLRKLAE